MCNKEHIFLLWIPVTSTPKLPICHCSQSVNIFLWTKKGKKGAKKTVLLYQDFVKKNAYKLNRQEFGEATKMTYKNEHMLKQK